MTVHIGLDPSFFSLPRKCSVSSHPCAHQCCFTKLLSLPKWLVSDAPAFARVSYWPQYLLLNSERTVMWLLHSAIIFCRAKPGFHWLFTSPGLAHWACGGINQLTLVCPCHAAALGSTHENDWWCGARAGVQSGFLVMALEAHLGRPLGGSSDGTVPPRNLSSFWASQALVLDPLLTPTAPAWPPSSSSVHWIFPDSEVQFVRPSPLHNIFQGPHTSWTPFLLSLCLLLHLNRGCWAQPGQGHLHFHIEMNWVLVPDLSALENQGENSCCSKKTFLEFGMQVCFSLICLCERRIHRGTYSSFSGKGGVALGGSEWNEDAASSSSPPPGSWAVPLTHGWGFYP